MFTFLQTPNPEDIAHHMDSVRTATHQVAQSMISDPGGTLKDLGQQAIQFGIKVVAAILIYIIGAWLIRLVKRWLKQVFRRRQTEATAAQFIANMVSVILTIVLIVSVIGALGINTTSIAALLAAGGMAIGMAMGGAVQNFAGGVMLVIFKPFKVGDLIEAQGYTGVVTELSIVHTRLLTPDNRTIVLPNGALSNGTINNLTNQPLRRVDWNISLEYGTDEAACRQCLISLLKEDSRVLDATTPGAQDPFAAVSSLAESAVIFTVRGWVRPEDYWGVFFDFNSRAYVGLQNAGFHFPFPQLDVHIKDKIS